MTHMPDRFIFIRHGRTAWNEAGLTMGRSDLRLSRGGIGEALALRPVLAELDPTSVWVSPLRRCRQTARLCLPAPPKIPVRVVPDLQERAWGRWEGWPKSARDPRDAEPSKAFHARVALALAAIDDRQLPLVVSHSGVLRALLALLGDHPWRGPVPHARPILFERGAPLPARVRTRRDP